MTDHLPFHNLTNNNSIQELNIQHNYPLESLNLEFEVTPYDDRQVLDNQINHLIQPECQYYFCTEFNHESFTERHIKLLSFNISSLPLHFDTFSTQILDSIHFNFDIIGMCETRLNDNISSLYSLNNYSKHLQNKSTTGGGLVIFTHNNLQSIHLSEISLNLPHIESLFLRISEPHNFIVGMIYRPPNSSITDFLSTMEFILPIITKNVKTPCYLLGDFNINLLNYNSDNNVKDFVNMLYTYYIFPVITKPTRVTSTSATLIDHIWTNNFHTPSTNGIIYTTLSDHFPIFTSFPVSGSCKNNFTKSIVKTIINHENIDSFKLDLASYQWEQVMKSQDVNEDYDNYFKKFTDLYKKHFITKTVNLKGKFLNKPYITSAIKTSIRHRHKLQKLYAKWPLSYGEEFKTYRNTLTTVIREAKSNYYKNMLNQHTGNMKKTWETINNLTGRNKAHLPNHFMYNNKCLNSNEEIAEGFNEHFSNVATNTARPQGHHPASFHRYLPPSVPYSFYLRPTTVDEIITIIRHLKGTSPGHDNIHINVIKECADIMAPFLKYIINLSFQLGCVPKQLQVAKINPIFKKGNNTQFDNYRPISLLSSVSKIFEKVMVSRLMDYLNKHLLLSPYQYGFRPGFSTERAIHDLSQKIYHALDNKLYQITLFCDLSKAFDTISHTILLHKLNIYGIRGPAYLWFQSYLSHRKQYVVINNHSSSFRDIHYGIPQGSILGPVLFLLYINDITHSSNRLKFLLFADDTTVYLQDTDIQRLQDSFNEELIHVSEWLLTNKLTLNISKTCYMLSHTLLHQPPPINIIFSNNPINRVNKANFLGVTLDNNLKWKFHIDNINTKISKLIGVLYKIRNSLTQDSIKTIYYSLAYPHFIYCSAVWGGAYNTYTQTLFTTQKKLLRVMFHGHRFAHTNPYFAQHKLLKLPDIIKLQTGLFIYNSLKCNPSSPDPNPDLVIISNDPNTRRPLTLRMPLCRTAHAQQSVLVRGAREWNSLPDHLKLAPSKYAFKHRLKLLFLSSYNNLLQVQA